MESEQMTVTRRQREKLQSMARMRLCKNSCGGNRRNGSAYCQKCSDAHKVQKANDTRLERKIQEQIKK